MNVKIKSLTISNFKQGEKGELIDKSEMTIEEMKQLKQRVAEVVGVNKINVTIHYEGIE